jgi:hypothetical protein
MNPHDDQALRDLLKQSIAPVRDAEPRRDLWPQMLQRLDEAQPVRVPWFDWVLAALASAVLIFFPSLIPAVLYHL